MELLEKDKVNMDVIKWAVLCGISLCFVQNCNGAKTIYLKTGTEHKRYTQITGQTVYYLNSDQVYQYLGIPYAYTSIDRFNKASPQSELTTRKFKAVNIPPACRQFTKSPFPWYSNPTDDAEDCLYMNIWVPTYPYTTEKKAVMVFIHGGDHRYGSIQDEQYNGIATAAEGGVLVVTVNYRLGFFAYFTANSTSASGNNALKDILEALRFVNTYIGDFGGDKTKVTIVGQGSGATNVAMLSLSGAAEGLYTRLILQSPLALFKQNTSEQNLAYSQQLAKLKGCSNDSYTIYEHSKDVATCMKRKLSDDIMYGDYELGPKSSPYLYPQWGDDTFEKSPRDVMKSGNFPCNDVIIGVNQDEGSYLLTAYEYQDIFGFFGEKNAHVNRTLGEHIIRAVATSQGLSDLDSIVSHYLPDDLQDDKDYKIRTQVVTALGNIVHQCPAVYLAKEWRDKCTKVYFYLFTYRKRDSPWADWMGMTHFDEIEFLFGKALQANVKGNAPEVSLSRFMIKSWGAFSTGRMYYHGWQPYEFYMLLNPDKITAKNYSGAGRPFSENCDFLKPKFGF